MSYVEFKALFAAMTSSDESIASAAKQDFDNTSQKLKLEYLYQMCHDSSVQQSVRDLSHSNLCHYVESNLSNLKQVAITELLNMYAAMADTLESENTQRRQQVISMFISMAHQNHEEEDERFDLKKWIIRWIFGKRFDMQEVAFTLLRMAPSIARVDSSSELQRWFQNGLQSAVTVVRISAAAALITMMLFYQKQDFIGVFQPLVPVLLKTVSEIPSNDNAVMQDTFNCTVNGLVTLVRETDLLSHHVESIVNLVSTQLDVTDDLNAYSALIEAFPNLLKSLAAKRSSVKETVWKQLHAKFRSTFEEETNGSKLLEASTALCASLEGIDEKSLTKDFLVKIVDDSMLLLTRYEQSVRESTNHQTSSNEVIKAVAILPYTLLKLYTDEDICFFDILMNKLIDVLQLPNSEVNLVSILKIIEKLLRSGITLADTRLRELTKVALNSMKRQSAEPRRYGASVISASAKMLHQDFIFPVLDRLAQLLEHPQAHDSTNMLATEMALSAMAAVLKNNKDADPDDTYVPIFLKATSQYPASLPMTAESV